MLDDYVRLDLSEVGFAKSRQFKIDTVFCTYNIQITYIYIYVHISIFLIHLLYAYAHIHMTKTTSVRIC